MSGHRGGVAVRWMCGVGFVSAFLASPVNAATAHLWNPAAQSFDRGGAEGGDVVAPISLSGADGVTTMDFSFTYDPAVLRATSVHRTGYTNAHDLSYDLSSPGLVELSLDGGGPLAGSGEVAWVVFRVDGAPGTASDLSWNYAFLNGGTIPALMEDGRVRVLSATSTISMPDGESGSPGTVVGVPISGSPVDGALGIDLKVAFNPGVLHAVSVAKTSLTESMSLTYNLTTPGQAVISLFSAQPISGSGPLVTVTYSVVGPIGDSTPLNVTRGDLNEREISTMLDDGLFAVCDATDQDGDTFTGCAGDCDDGDPLTYPGAPERCNGFDDDCNGAIDDGVVAPVGRPVLRAAKSGSTADLSWSAVAGADGYDAVRGRLEPLRGSGGDFATATEACLANDLAATWLADPAPPDPASAFWYLVRPVNCEGAGTYDALAPTQSESRDAEIGTSAASCP